MAPTAAHERAVLLLVSAALISHCFIANKATTTSAIPRIAAPWSPCEALKGTLPIKAQLRPRHFLMAISHEKLRGYMLLNSNQKTQRKRSRTLCLLPSYVLSPITRGISQKWECKRGGNITQQQLPYTLKIEVL